MHEDMITSMRRRLEQVRKVKALAHDPHMILVLDEIIRTAEADIAKLEKENQEASGD